MTLCFFVHTIAKRGENKGAALGWLFCIADISYKVRKNFAMRTIDFCVNIYYDLCVNESEVRM